MTDHSNGPDMGHYPPVVPGLFRLPGPGESEPHLLGGRCPECGGIYYPRPRFCPKCLKETKAEGMPSRGSLYSFTVIRTKAPLGLPEPYGVGLVDLEGSGLRVFGLLDPSTVDRYRIGLPVRLTVGPMGVNMEGMPCLRPYFTPLKETKTGAGR